MTGATRGPVAEALVRAGYEAVQLRKHLGMWMLDTTLAVKPLSLCVDTGAANSYLDLLVAPKRYGVEPYSDSVMTTGIGGVKEVRRAPVPGFKLGGVHCPHHTWLLIGGITGDGLLGLDLLSYFSAWVDAESGTLWLRNPVKQEPGLQGDWQGVAVEHKTGTSAGLVAAMYTLRIDGMMVVSEAQGEVEKGRFNVVADATPKRIDFGSPVGAPPCQGIYKLDGDVLTIAMAWCEGDAPGRPKSFDIKANNTTVITFHRVKGGLPPLRLP